MTLVLKFNRENRETVLCFSFIPGTKAKTEVVNNEDGTYTVTYVPLTSGMYTLLLKYGGKPVPGFPAKVMADPAVDTSRVKVFGPGVEGQGLCHCFVKLVNLGHIMSLVMTSLSVIVRN